MGDAPKDTCAICGVPEAPGVAFERGFNDGYNRGLEEAAKIADKHLRESKEASSMARPDEVATKVGCWAWGRAAEKIAAAIRAQIGERDDG